MVLLHCTIEIYTSLKESFKGIFLHCSIFLMRRGAYPENGQDCRRLTLPTKANTRATTRAAGKRKVKARRVTSMKLDDDDQDAIYAKGYADGRADVLKQLKEHWERFGHEKEKWTDLMKDPEKLAALAENDPRFSVAMTTAVVALLIAEHEKEKAWEATELLTAKVPHSLKK